ncbi:MAG: glycosyltransferase family 39 protein, partial [Myxococcota bacterium]
MSDGAVGGRAAPSLALVAFFFLLTALLHVRTFVVPHVEGDEASYLALSQEMGWDISHYTTRDHPRVSRFPNSIYRQPLFHHPPLYPLVLKVGAYFGNAVAAGLLFQLFAMGLLLVYAERAARRLALSDAGRLMLLTGLLFCPILLFSTTRLHHDGLLAIFVFAAFTVYLEALDEQSTAKSVAAGLLFALALNVRYKGLTALPLVLLAQVFSLARARAAASAAGRPPSEAARDPRSWRCFAIVSALIALLGLPHYVRILATYGSLLPGSFMSTAPALAAANEFLSTVVKRSRLQVFGYLVLTFPLILAWFSPMNARLLRAELASWSWRGFHLVAAIYFCAVCLATSHQQLRYFAVMTP